jgi:23S rRNA (adenine2503-C2)-methyltransferase
VKRVLFDLTLSELRSLLAAQDEKPFRAAQIWQAAYRELVSSYEEMTPLPTDLRARLALELPLSPLEPIGSQHSPDGRTRKTLFRLEDGETIETVLMAYERRHTVCVSTQVGCPLACAFCATGASGFTRDLTAGEIVGQTIDAARTLRTDGQHLTNVVYMGMGEPFLNLEATLKSVRILNTQEGFRLGARHITISTVGIVPGIERLGTEGLQVNLAVSLHAGTDALRDRLVPVNRHYPISTLLAAVRSYIEATHRRVSFEVALADGVNDAPEHAEAVASRLRGLLCHVNLIPLNPTPGSGLRPSPRARIDTFASRLETAGIPVTVRLGRGAEIQAGCGQLRSRNTPDH